MSGIKLTYAILEVLTSFQGIVVGIYLLIRSTRKKPTFFLGLFLLLFAIEILPAALKDFDIWQKWHGFKWLPFKNIWLLSPLFLVYTLNVSIFRRKNTFNWLFIPGLLFLGLKIVLDFLPSNLFGIVDFDDKYDFYVFLFGHLFSLFVGIFNLRFLKNHIKTINQYFSSLYMKELNWAKTFIYFGLCLCLTSLIMLVTTSHFSLVRLPLLIAELFTVYWLSFYGSKQLNIYRVLSQPNEFGLTFSTKRKRKANKKEKTELGLLMVKLQEYFKTKEPFTQPDINLIDVANHLNVHPKKLSQAINLYGGTNFNRFVNKFRIEIAKNRLLDPGFKNLSIEGIGSEVGFVSKSTFYNAFKNYVGKTPLEYKKGIQEESGSKFGNQNF